MTPDELEREKAWALWAAAVEAEYGDCAGGAGVRLARQFPIPDTTGLGSAEAEAALGRWRAQVSAAVEQLKSPAAAPVGAPAPADAPQPQAPVA